MTIKMLPVLTAALARRAAMVIAVVAFVVLASSSVGAEDEVFLPVDISGVWESVGRLNCEGYTAGSMVYTGNVPDLESIMNSPSTQLEIYRGCQNNQYTTRQIYIIQDCLEITLTAENQYDLHHTITDGQYITDDFSNGVPFAFQVSIEPPNQEEIENGAEAVVVWHPMNPRTGLRRNPNEGSIRRYLNSNGYLVETKDLMLLDPDLATSTEDTKGFWFYRKVEPIEGCSPSGYDPDACSNRVYTDTPTNWTIACCETMGGDGYIDSILAEPRPDYYNGERSKGNVDCDV